MDLIIIENHYGINILRDDLLIGGTKSILMPTIVNDDFDEYVYASPVYGGFQIALSAYCKSVNKKATIFCAKRKIKHTNTLKCELLGATIIEVPYGYLNVVEKKTRDYCADKLKTKKIIFGVNTTESKLLIADRVKNVINKMETIPDEIWCAVGSGTLISGILQGVPNNIKVIGVQVGGKYNINENYSNLEILKYPKPFEYESKLKINFPSTPNYDLKALELCLKHNTNKKNILFWNVL